MPGKRTDVKVTVSVPVRKGSRRTRARLLPLSVLPSRGERRSRRSTVTLFARFRGWSTLGPRSTAMWQASSCSGTLARIGVSTSCVRGMRITLLQLGVVLAHHGIPMLGSARRSICTPAVIPSPRLTAAAYRRHVYVRRWCLSRDAQEWAAIRCDM